MTVHIVWVISVYAVADFVHNIYNFNDQSINQ